MWAELELEPLADVDYVSVADGTTLAELDRIDGPALASLAVRFGSTPAHRQRAARRLKPAPSHRTAQEPVEEAAPARRFRTAGLLPL